MKITQTLFFNLAAAVLLVSCASSSIRLTAPVNGADECLLKPGQLKYIQMPRQERRAFFADKASRLELSQQGPKPRKITLSWQDEEKASDYTVTLSTTRNFAPGTCVEYTAKANSVEVDNLLIATKYYWKVNDGARQSAVGTFVTADVAPRLMRVPNIGNTRDLGGRIGLNGRRVKQNMVFRSGGLNSNAKAINYTLDELLAASEDARRNRASMEKLMKDIEVSTDEFNSSLVSKEWTVFRPQRETCTDEDLASVIALPEIPASIFGGKAVKMTGAESDNSIHLEASDESVFAVFMQAIDVKEPCLLPFQCGADYFWRLAVNGEVVCDMWPGNNKLTNKANYIMAVPLKSGRNLITLVLKGGSASFCWHYGPVEGGLSREQIIDKTKETIQVSMNNQNKVVKIDANGKKMFNPGTPYLTNEGRRYMLEDLEIKSDIDLRSDDECACMTGSPLGPEVKWFHISFSAYAGVNSVRGRKAFTEVFKVFLDEKNYPIDFHCIAGQDRTGTVACIINGLLGVSEEELYLDWEVTGFGNKSTDFRHETLFDKLINTFAKFEGATLNERIENYVLSLGFTHDDIQHLRDILLE